MIHRVIGLLFFLFFVFSFAIIPWQISDKGVPPDSPLPVYPQFFPRILAIFGCLLSIALIFKSFVKTETAEEGVEIPSLDNLRRIGGVTAIICLYVLCFNFLGYLISTSICLVLLMGFFGLRDYRYYILIIATLPFAVYYLFKKMLYVPFPVGIFGF